MFHHLALLLAGLGSVANAYVDISTVPRESSAQVVPGAYLIELDSGSFPTRRSLEARTAHVRLYDHLNKRGIGWKLREEFDDGDIFRGASIEVKKSDELFAVSEVAHVVGIYPIYIHDAPQLSLMGSPVQPLGESVITHNMTGINKLHAEKFQGEGIKIGIIDSGVDYNLDIFGKSFGKKDSKFYTGYDFVGDAYNGGTDQPKPDKDPLDTCFGHGTAVAGVIGANFDPTYKFIGVAPKAKLAAYRIFSCTGKSNDELIVKALIQAYNDGNDVINLSLVTNTGWTSHVLSVVANRISRRGRVVVSAAGNNGLYGPWLASAPGTGTGVISVGSVDAASYVTATAALSNGHDPIPYFSLKPLPIPGDRQIYVAPDLDACAPMPAGANLTQYVVLARRGACSFAQKITNIKAAGGQYALFYNTAAGLESVDLTGITGALILKEDGEYLLQFNTTASVTISFPPNSFTNVGLGTAGLVSATSTWGPTNDLFFKPNVAAPGGTVLAPLPASMGLWNLVSGTSFSSPIVAGASALMLQARGKSYQTATEAKSWFELTSKTVRLSNAANAPIHSLAQQGSGLINAYDAIKSTTFVTPSILELNDTVHSDYSQYITIHNRSWKSKTYTITHVAASTVLTVDPTNGLGVQTPSNVNNAATVQFSTTKVTVWPMLLNMVKVTVKPPTGLDASTYPVFTGQIKITSGDEQTVVSYMGVAGAMKDRKVIDTSSVYFKTSPVPTLLKGTGARQTGPANYTFQGTDYPLFYYRLAAGSQVVKVDLVSCDYTLPTKKREYASEPVGRNRISLERRSSTGDLSGSRHPSFLQERSHHHQIARSPAISEDIVPSEDISVRKRVNSSMPPRSSSSLDTTYTDSGSFKSRRGFLRDMFDWLFPNKPKNPQAPKGSDINTVGAIAEFNLQPRNVLADLANNGYEAISMQNRKFANGTLIPNGCYRVLLRGLRFTGDYEMWLSPIVNVAVP